MNDYDQMIAIQVFKDEVQATGRHIRDAIDEMKVKVLEGLQREIDAMPTIPPPNRPKPPTDPLPKPPTTPRTRNTSTRKRRVTKAKDFG